MPPVLQRMPGSRPSTIAFNGRSFVLVAEANSSHGSMQIVRNGVVVHAVDLQPAMGVFALDDADAHPNALVGVLALLLGAAVTWRVRPWDRTSRAPLWLGGVLSSMHLLFWIGQCIGTTNDSSGYVNGAAALLAGSPAYFPPGYPMLVGLLDRVSGIYLGNVVTLVQHAMIVAEGVWIYLLLRRLVSDRAALCGGLLAGALPSVLTMAQAIMSETSALFAMTAATDFAVRATETGRMRFAVVGGALAGWAGLIRVVPLAGLIPALGAIFLLPWAARRVSLLAAAGSALATVMLVPMIWFGLRSGRPALADSAGFHLYNRVVTEQRLLYRMAPQRASGRAPRHRRPAHDALVGGALPRWRFRPGLRRAERSGCGRGRRGHSRASRRVCGIRAAARAARAIRRIRTVDSTVEDALSPTPAIESPAPLPLTAAALRWRWDAEAVQRVIWPVLACLSLPACSLAFGYRSADWCWRLYWCRRLSPGDRVARLLRRTTQRTSHPIRRRAGIAPDGVDWQPACRRRREGRGDA